MITKLTGTLSRMKDDAARVQVGAFEYEVWVSETARRRLQLQTGREVTLFITEYLEGTNTGNRFVPRLLGFETETEQEFFELLCTVNKIGPKKALRALARPVREIAAAVNRKDAKWLSTLPGIAGLSAETVVTTLHKKVGPFLSAAEPAGQPALSPDEPPAVVVEDKPKRRKTAAAPVPEPDLPPAGVLDDLYAALMSLGHSPQDAQAKVQQLASSGKAFKSLDEAMMLVYSRG